MEISGGLCGWDSLAPSPARGDWLGGTERSGHLEAVTEMTVIPEKSRVLVRPAWLRAEAGHSAGLPLGPWWGGSRGHHSPFPVPGLSNPVADTHSTPAHQHLHLGMSGTDIRFWSFLSRTCASGSEYRNGRAGIQSDCFSWWQTHSPGQ